MIRISTLASSSKGNASVISSGSTHLLVDTGISALRIRKGLEECGLSINQIDGIFYTHEHSDHLCGLGVLAKKNVLSLYCSRYLSRDLRGIAPSAKLTYIEPGCSFEVGNITITPIEVSHDAADPLGYIFQHGATKLGYITCPKKEECVSPEELVGRIFLWDGCDSSACDKLYHRTLLETFRYPEGKVCEDVPTTYRIVLKARKAVLCDRPFYNYYHRPDSITTDTVISEKTFHFSQHTAVILPYIRENHPKLETEARYLRVRSLVHAVQSVDLASETDRKTFQTICKACRRDLRSYTWFFLTNSLFGRRERITNLLLAFGLYRSLRPLFSKQK